MTSPGRDDHPAADVVRELLAEEARRAVGDHADDHPGLDQMSAYLADELDADAEGAVRSHLVACRRCSDVLLDLEPMSQPDLDLDTLDGPSKGADEAHAAPVDFAKAAAWRDLSRRRQGMRRTPLRIYGALAATLLTAVALGYFMSSFLGGAGRAVGPQANVPIQYLDELTRSRSAETTHLEIDAAADYWVLILTPPVGERFPSYEVEVVTTGTGEGEDAVLFRSGDLLASDHGALRLGIPRELVPEGASTLRLRGVDGDDRELLEEYPLQIRYR